MSRSSSPLSPDKPLGGRYRIMQQLGIGGFGRTFLAADLHLPGYPQCVIKHLKPQAKSEDTLLMARRCFNTEAQVLYRLGVHDRIPRLLAHFEDNQEFYLAQEFIEGDPLSQELTEGKPWSQAKTLTLLQEILQVLEFVHSEQVIHRDLKPSNLIRRSSDQKLVLIDFGAVKQVSSQNFDSDTGQTNLTISIGTQGYMPGEQLAGKPRFSSDVYAAGILGIQALTGLHPKYLGEDAVGEIDWHSFATHADPALIAVIDRMVRYDFRERYPTASEALAALKELPATIAEDTTEPPSIAVPATLRQSTAAASAAANKVAFKHSAGPVAVQASLQTIAPETEQLDFSELGEDGLVTALWMPSESFGNSASVPTGATKLLGRLNAPTQTMAAGSATWRRQRWQWQPWLLLGAVTAIGLSLAAVEARSPMAIKNWFERNPLSFPTPTPVKPSPSPSPLPTDPMQLATVLVRQATQLQNNRKYEEALQLYDRAIAAKPDFADAYTGRCEVLNRLNRPEAAIVSCNDALAYDPNDPITLWSKGNALMLQNRTYEALKIYEDVTALKPDYAPGWVRRGVALQTLGRSAEALNALDRGIALERNSAEAWITKGAAQLNLQRYNDAIASLDKALELQPGSNVAKQLRQQARDRVGR